MEINSHLVMSTLFPLHSKFVLFHEVGAFLSALSSVPHWTSQLEFRYIASLYRVRRDRVSDGSCCLCLSLHTLDPLEFWYQCHCCLWLSLQSRRYRSCQLICSFALQLEMSILCLVKTLPCVGDVFSEFWLCLSLLIFLSAIKACCSDVASLDSDLFCNCGSQLGEDVKVSSKLTEVSGLSASVVVSSSGPIVSSSRFIVSFSGPIVSCLGCIVSFSFLSSLISFTGSCGWWICEEYSIYRVTQGEFQWILYIAKQCLP